MNLRDTVNSAIEARISKIALPIVGQVTDYHDQENMVTVRCTSRTGRGYVYYELPWFVEAPGTYCPTPINGTHVVVGFRMGDEQCPILLSRYNPYYKNTVREYNKRLLETMATTTAGTLI